MAADDYVKKAFCHIGEPRNPLDEEFVGFIEAKLDEFHVPSVSIAVVDGENTYASGFGMAELPSTKATPSTLYMAGSTTKSFTALSVLQLIEANNLVDVHGIPIMLKSPVSSLLPGFAVKHNSMPQTPTLEDILSHRTGLPGHEQAYFYDDSTLDNLLTQLPHLDFTAEPRTSFQYNNIMFAIASAVIERLSGQSLRDYMKESIWNKLDMGSTFMALKDAQDFVQDSQGAGLQNPVQLARGYFWDPDKEQFLAERWMDSPSVAGAGHMISSVLDYAKYLRAMINGVEAIISEASKTELRTPRIMFPGIGGPADMDVGTATYTLGWMKYTYPPGIDVYSHPGGLGGFGSYMAYAPAVKWGIVLFSNTAVTSSFLQEAIFRSLLDEKLGIPAEMRPDYFAAAKKRADEVTDALWHKKPSAVFPQIPAKRLPKSLPIEAYAGEYRSRGYGSLVLRLVDDDGERQLEHLGDYFGTRSGGKAEVKMLRLQHLTKSPWNYLADFEHASGEFFLLKCRTPDDDPHLIDKYLKAEFRIDADGRVREVGVQYESGIPLAWYEKIHKQDS